MDRDVKGRMIKKSWRKTISILERGLREFIFTKGFGLFERPGVHNSSGALLQFYLGYKDTLQRENLWPRELPLLGIDLNVEEQKRLLERMSLDLEKIAIPKTKNGF